MTRQNAAVPAEARVTPADFRCYKTDMKTTAPTETALDRLGRGLYMLADRDALPLALSAKVVAAALGIKTESLYDQVRQGTCPIEPLRVGERLIRFRRDDLLAFLLGAAAA